MSGETATQGSTSNNRRFLHFTLKITDRAAAKKFFCDVLGMKILRHEEMDSGCVAQCNGDYQSPWSKTMAGYGDENSFFLMELNFNYDVQGYKYGNDFASITIYSKQAVANARKSLDQKFIEKDNGESVVVRSPDGHQFILFDKDVNPGNDPVQCLSLNVSNLKKSTDYYSRILQLQINENESDDQHVKLFYGVTTNQGSKVKTTSGFRFDNQTQLELIQINEPVVRGTGYGRKAFSTPVKDVDLIAKTIVKEGYNILIQPMELGEAPDPNIVKVVILSDPDGNEICFVGEEKYINACETDPGAEEKFYKGLENTPDVPNKYLIGEDEKNKRQGKK